MAGLKILSTAGRKGIRYNSECVKPSVKHSGSMLMVWHFMVIAKILSKILSKMTEIWTQINTVRECNLEGVRLAEGLFFTDWQCRKSILG